MDLPSRLRAIVRGNPSAPRRELTYVPEGGYETVFDMHRVGEILGGQPVRTAFGDCLVIDRRYEANRRHGAIRIEDCEVTGTDGLEALDPSLFEPPSSRPSTLRHAQGRLEPSREATSSGRSEPVEGRAPEAPSPRAQKTIFLDLETTGLSGGAGTIAFLVGCGCFDFGAFQVRQFLLTSHAAERALLAAVADFFDGADLIVTYNGKTFDVPVMETRWLFHRMEMPLDGVPHFDMLHPARRLWRARGAATADRPEDGGCRLTTLERMLFDVERVGDVPGFEIPGRFFQFLRTADPRPLEPVLEHNRLDLVSLAAVTARAARLARQGHEACRDGAEALSLGRIYERAGALERAEACYRLAASGSAELRGEALYRLGLRYRRDRRFEAAAAVWRELLSLRDSRGARRNPMFVELRQFAAEALAIHMEHRARDLDAARVHALFALEESDDRRAGGVRHRLARLDRKIREKKDAQLFSN